MKTNMKNVLAIVGLLFGICFATSSWAQKIGDTADAVGGDDDDTEDEEDDGCGPFCVLAIFFSGEDDPTEPGYDEEASYNRTRVFLVHPYAYDYDGFKLIEHKEFNPDTGKTETVFKDPEDADMSDGYSWATRLSADYQLDVDKVHLGTFNIRIEGGGGFGIGAGYTGFFESVEGNIDHLHMPNIELFYDFLPASRAKLELFGQGIGFIYNGKAEWGGAGGLGLDWFVGWPFIFSARAAVGGINGTLYFRGRATLGISLLSIELLAGYDSQIFGTDNPIIYHGPLVGVRLWF